MTRTVETGAAATRESAALKTSSTRRRTAGSSGRAGLVPGLALALFWSPLPAQGLTGSTHLEDLLALEEMVVRTIARARPAFVFVKTQQDRGFVFNGGSGFVISPDGHVLTNDHVVSGARRIRVVATDGREFRADAVGHDPMGDVALLKLRDASDLPFLELGDSSKLRVGQHVIALGDPFLIGSENMFLQGPGGPPPGFEPAASLGVVSSLHRFSDTYGDAIQVDLAVNRGNSGGPLLTLDGKVAGITGKIETRFALGINTGAGYAIPANQIRRFLEPLKAAGGGAVFHGSLPGLAVARRALGKPGLPITAVRRGTAAADAGFRSGDLLLSIDGKEVLTRGRFYGILSTYPEGTPVTARVKRDGREIEVSVKLLSPRPYLGVDLVEAEGDDAGARVIKVHEGKAADRAGLKPDDVVVKFADEEVRSIGDLRKHLGTKRAGDAVRLEVVREGERVNVRVRLGSRTE